MKRLAAGAVTNRSLIRLAVTCVGQVHAQLAAAEPAVEDVLGVLFGLDHGVEQLRVPRRVLADAPSSACG